MDFSNATEGRYLIRRLSEFNPWWEQGTGASVTKEYVSLRSEFYELHKKLLTGDRNVYGVSGPDGIGKTALVKQLIAALIDSDFIEKFYRTPEFRSEAREAIVEPQRVLYLPLAAEPLGQLRGAEQLQAAVDYFETHQLSIHDNEDQPQYIILDDIDVFASQGNSDITGSVVETLRSLTFGTNRTLVMTAATDAQLPTDLIHTESDGGTITDATRHRIRPLHFEDFLRFRFRKIETTAKARRFHPGRARQALRESIERKDPAVVADQLATEVQSTAVPIPKLRREIAYYLTTGGYLGQRLVSPVGKQKEPLDSILRGQGTNDLEKAQSAVRTEIRQMLRARGPELGVNGEVIHLEQLCALIAEEHPTSSVRYRALTDLFSVDRRTLRDNYFALLSQLHLFSHSPQYNNRRPRLVRVYLRDPGVANAFTRRDLNDVLKGDRNIGTALSKSIIFDHAIRLSHHLNDPRDPKRGIVKFWAGDNGELDCILKVNGRPLPIYLSESRDGTAITAPNGSQKMNVLTSFLTSDAMESERDPLQPAGSATPTGIGVGELRDYVSTDKYAGELNDGYIHDGDPVLGIAITNDKGTTSDSIELQTGDSDCPPILELPLWAFLRLG